MIVQSCQDDCAIMEAQMKQQKMWSTYYCRMSRTICCDMIVIDDFSAEFGKDLS